MRKLASLQRIRHVRSVEGADRIEVVGILGWECVSKKGEFVEGDPCVYFEIDSLLREDPRYEFLRDSSYRKDLQRFRLRTVRLRKQLSQGLALPLSLFPEVGDLPEGSDLTDLLEVEKYEPPALVQIAGKTRAFSWPIAKTDEPRVQLDEESGFIRRLNGGPYYISLKLDGTSCSYIVDPRDGEYHACGRNHSYERSTSNSFWQVSDRYGLEDKLNSLGQVALQGEIVGPGIQNNKLGLPELDFYVFNVVNTITARKFPLDEALEIAEVLGVPFVPVLERNDSFDHSVQSLLKMAVGRYSDHFPTAKKSQECEGIVVRSLCSSISFKAINNNFLLKDD